MRLALLVLALATTAHAQPAAPPPREVLTALTTAVLAPPAPVPMADGRTHLAYEIEVVNKSPFLVTIASVDVLDPGRADGGVQTLAGDALAAMFRQNGGERGLTLGPSHSGVLFLDVSFAAGEALPRALEHRFVTSMQARAGELDDHHGVEIDPASGVPRDITFVGAPTRLDRRRAIEVAPPLSGSGWVVGNGCCSPIEAHRGATNALDGKVYVAERFAIDFVQLDPDQRMFVGDKTKLESYPFFGAPVHSVADGVVVRAQDGLPEQTPTIYPRGVTAQDAGGNSLVVDLGGGRFAFYAHLQPGSLRVAEGDSVRRGQVLGLLGNSGNSDAPHLHFHVMDGPSPLMSNGLPYTFTRFTGQGRVASDDALWNAEVPPVAPSPLDGPRRGVLPLDLQVVEFPTLETPR